MSIHAMLRVIVTSLVVGACAPSPASGTLGAAADRWTFPLVGALEDGLLLTPVTVDGRGPFLFAIDPNAKATLVDEQLLKDAGLRAHEASEEGEDSEAAQPQFYAAIRAFEIGTLMVEGRDALVVKTGTFDASGRRIFGLLGRDVLADALVLGFDRDNGIGTLETARAFKPPAGAAAHALDRALSIDLFRTHNVWIQRDAKTYYLAPRKAVPPAIRIERWDVGALGTCKALGCVTPRLIDPVAGKPADPTRPHPGLVLAVTRDEAAGGMELEVVLEAKDRPELPRLVVNMGPNADRVHHHLKPEWLGVTLLVVDASPFPRACIGAPPLAGCVDLLAR